MRIVIKQDFKITDDESNELQRQFTDLMFENTGITPEFYIEKIDYSSVPMQTDSDGDTKPSKLYRKEIADDIFKRYTEWGTDHIILLVHEDNWSFKGIWGTNWSLMFHSYHMELCRFDRDNMANSLGTLYHEVMHSFDSLIKSTIGVDINPLFEGDYDRNVVHGKGSKYSYIRHRENTDALRLIANPLKQSYAKRKGFHDGNISKMKTIISLAEKLIVLYRSKLNKKDGVKK